MPEINVRIEHNAANNNSKQANREEAKFIFGKSYLTINADSIKKGQVFITPDEKRMLIFKGTIYNTEALKKAHFPNEPATSTPGTILLLLAQKLGRECLPLLNGSFAFIFVDLEKAALWAARDSMGNEPLYYYADQNYLIFSSTLKAVFTNAAIRKELNENQLANYLLYRYPKPPETFYKNVYEVEASQVLKIEREKIDKGIFELQKEPFPVYDTLPEITDALLQQAVSSQIPTQADFGVFLSGGVDSTLLLAKCNELGYTNIPAFSIVHIKEDISYGTEDVKHVKAAAKLFSGDLHTFEINASLLSGFTDYCKTMDQPIADNAGWLTWYLAKETEKYLKVVFSGAGGDEFFAGYNRHKAFQIYLNIAPLGTPLLHKLANFPEGEKVPFRKSFRLANKFLSSIQSEPEKTWQNFVTLSGATTLNQAGQPSKVQFYKKDYLHQALLHDQRNYLIADILQITKKAAMSTGLDIRTPYLDNNLLNFARTLEAEKLLSKGQKWILKDLLSKKGGKEFTQRAKEGFGMPLGKWLKGKEGKVLLFFLEKDKLLYDYLNYEKVQNLVKAHLQGKKDYSAELYSFILLSAWLEVEFR